ncbi:MAG: hypothetical protein MUE52_06680 [Tabrizicola sp.]|nr:hypothetical protein [Tabrizicola sp.]
MRASFTSAIAFLGLAACVSETPSADPYPFVGSWDCGVATFTFTNTTYNNGTDTYPIRFVARDGRNYTLRLGDGSTIGLGLVTDTGLTWISGATSDQFSCRRVN